MRGGFAVLSEEERFLFSCYMLSIYNQFELAYHEYQKGNVPAEIWGKYEYEIPIWLSLPGGGDWYEQDRGRYSAAFQEYIANALDSYAAPPLHQ